MSFHWEILYLRQILLYRDECWKKNMVINLLKLRRGRHFLVGHYRVYIFWINWWEEENQTKLILNILFLQKLLISISTQTDFIILLNLKCLCKTFLSLISLFLWYQLFGRWMTGLNSLIPLGVPATLQKALWFLPTCKCLLLTDCWIYRQKQLCHCSKSPLQLLVSHLQTSRQSEIQSFVLKKVNWSSFY